MQLKELAKAPTLKKVTVDDAVIVQAYGEPIEFYMHDRQDLPTYLKLAQIKDDQTEMWAVLKELLLDEKGQRILSGNEVMPVEIMVPVIGKAVEELGNTQPQTSQS
jgi:hypothetical protein